MDKKKVIKFIAITYLIAWTIQIIVSLILINNQNMIGTLVFQGGLAVCMFAPLAAALIVKGDLKGMGWKPKFKGNIGWLFFAAYVTFPLTVAGAALFFVFFPDLFDTTGTVLRAQVEAQGMDFDKMLESTGIDLTTFMIIQIVPGAITAPFFNIITAIGEETGWRGFLYPELYKSFGKAGTWLIGGAVWGAFHFPAILIGGYEYGLDPAGGKWLGLVVFTVVCIVLGVLTEIVYDRTKCIWYAALIHGSFNAMATLPQLFLNANNEQINKLLILGPMPNGIISVIPFALLAVILGARSIRKHVRKTAAMEVEAK